MTIKSAHTWLWRKIRSGVANSDFPSHISYSASNLMSGFFETTG